MKEYNDIEDLIKDHKEDCHITEEEICGYCGCDLFEVYYLFGRYRCDNCLKDDDYLAQQQDHEAFKRTKINAGYRNVDLL